MIQVHFIVYSFAAILQNLPHLSAMEQPFHSFAFTMHFEDFVTEEIQFWGWILAISNEGPM